MFHFATNFGIVDGVLKKLAEEGKINIAYIGLSEANVDTMTRRLSFCDHIFKDKILYFHCNYHQYLSFFSLLLFF